MMDVKCPLCGEVYHAEPAQVGKYIKCSRCGSTVPIVEGLAAVAPRPAHVVLPPVARPRSPTQHRRTWAIAAVSTFALIAFALIWSHFGNKSTVDTAEPRGLGKVAQRAAHAATSNPRNASGELEVADLDPDPSSVVPAAGTDVAKTRREPEPRPKAYHSLSTGAGFCRGKITGPGEGVLRVENGTAEDAALRLYDVSTEQTIRCLFVKADESVRITGISEGTYGLKYTTGLDWQDNMETFRWEPLYSRPRNSFRTPKSEWATRFSTARSKSRSTLWSVVMYERSRSRAKNS